MKRHPFLMPVLALTLCVALGSPSAAADGSSESESGDDKEARLLGGVRQLTFAGRRSGEGYFSADGKKMIFQSERESSNPFYQIYLLNLETGQTERVSPGVGKTTCAWIRPGGERALFASTHHDPKAEQKQQAELEKRESGETDRYAWDYDPEFEIYTKDLDSEKMTRLTHARGYDAEGCYSPDGERIVFASNRQAYERELTEKEQKHFERDPAYMMDLYIMDADGSNVRRLTEAPGYDGGPFFSAGGKKICWRRFGPNGHTADLFTMNADGSGKKRLTNNDHMSWAPFFHPSGDYLIYATNRHGFQNFELYLIDAEGERDPVRVTYTDGFDGLPAFHPSGKKLAWTSKRGSEDQSQIFLARWNDTKARKLLGLNREPQSDAVAEEDDAEAAEDAPSFEIDQTTAEITPDDLKMHVNTLASEELAGRLTGTEGERKATAYVASVFERLGLSPAGEDGSYFQPFEFTAGVSLGEDNELTLHRDGEQRSYKVDEQWRPLAFSETGAFEPKPIAFAGYGIVAPNDDGDGPGYDSYAHLDVQDKWVMVLRFLPSELEPERRQELNRYASLRHKAMIARDKGAAGLIVVSGPEADVKKELVPLSFDASMAGTSIPAVSVSNELASAWLKAAGKDLEAVQKKLDRGEGGTGLALDGLKLGAQIDLEKNRRTGRNVLARLEADGKTSGGPGMIGGHVDHLGRGPHGGSRGEDVAEDAIHNGADDNASGVAALMEIAQWLKAKQTEGELDLKRDVVFAAWSGEELGLIGSSHFAEQRLNGTGGGHGAHGGDAHGESPHGKSPHGQDKGGEGSPKHQQGQKQNAGDGPEKGSNKKNQGKADTARSKGRGQAKGQSKDKGKPEDPPKGEEKAPGQGHGTHDQAHGADRAVAAYLNMDMVGRYREKLTLQGVGSSEAWSRLIEQANVPVGLRLKTQKDAYLPTDSTAFYARGVPVLSAFTGVHEDYHKPTDTPDKLNYDGLADVAQLVGLVGRAVAEREEAPDYVAQKRPGGEGDGPLRAYLGTIPDYSGDDDVGGVKLQGVAEGGPADEAGLQSGDVVVKLAGKKVENIYDYTYAIRGLKVGEEVEIEVRRDGEVRTLSITPASRQ